jgi:methylated-DNA-[protein]-cysteine S-methyltransferase
VTRAGDGFHLFGTAIGTCAIAWTARGISRVCLPDPSRKKAGRSRSSTGASEKPPRFVADVARRIAHHLGGEPQRFADVTLDMTGIPPFAEKVYRVLRRVPAGRTVTYADLAKAAGSPGAARAVGQAMAKNPFVIIVPCHRVLTSSGTAGGFSAFGGTKTKLLLLAGEGVTLR